MKRACRLLISAVLGFLIACNGQQKPKSENFDVDTEIVQIKKQLEGSPNSSFLHEQLANLLAAKGDWEGSEKEMNAAMQLDPHNPLPCIEAALTYRVRGMTQKEQEMLNRAVAIDPENPLSHFVLGVMYERQSDAKNATAEFVETKRLIDTLSLPGSSMATVNRIVPGPRGETWYHDRFGHEFLLDSILAPLKKKLLPRRK